MDSFLELIDRAVLVITTLLVIALLVLMPAMTLAGFTLGALAAFWLLAHTSVQVARSPERQLALARPGYLSVAVRDDDSRGPASLSDEPWHQGDEVPDELAEDATADDQDQAAGQTRWAALARKYNEQAARWQPETEPTYRHYLLGQAWIDLAATLTEWWGQLVYLISEVRTETDRRLSGRKRARVLFPVRWSAYVALAATVVVAAVVGLAIGAVCALGLIAAGIAWSAAVISLRAAEITVAWARNITLPCQACERQILLPSYECRNQECEERHDNLIPNQYGALWHPCLCGERLPTTILFGKWRLKAYCTNPKCGLRLPPGIGRFAIRHIPILGARQAGKSTLSCLMLRDLERQLKDRHGSLDFEDDRDRDRLGLDQDCQTVSKTTPKAGLRPALITVNHPGRSRRLLYFFDPAGEDIDESSSLGQHAFISYMSSFVIALDPLTIPGAATLAGAPSSPGDTSHIPSSGGVLETLANTLLELEHSPTRPGQRARERRIERVAVVLTKADRLADDEQEQVIGHCRQWLVRMGLANQLTALERVAGRVEYVASGLSERCSRVDYAGLALWISGLEDKPVERPPDPRHRPGATTSNGSAKPGPPADPASTTGADSGSGAKQAQTPPALAQSYRGGRISLLTLAVIAAAFSWFIVLDVLLRWVVSLIH